MQFNFEKNPWKGRETEREEEEEGEREWEKKKKKKRERIIMILFPCNYESFSHHLSFIFFFLSFFFVSLSLSFFPFFCSILFCIQKDYTECMPNIRSVFDHTKFCLLSLLSFILSLIVYLFLSLSHPLLRTKKWTIGT